MELSNHISSYAVSATHLILLTRLGMLTMVSAALESLEVTWEHQFISLQACSILLWAQSCKFSVMHVLLLKLGVKIIHICKCMWDQACFFL